MNPKISVIVPVYNVENYVERCLNSIIGQTYDNLEIIVVNDGSTDNSETICRRIANQNDRIKVFSKENGGLSDARNYGLDRATGEYISFIDSDDYISPFFYETAVDRIRKYNADIVSVNWLSFNNDTNVEHVENKNDAKEYVYHDSEIISNYLVSRNRRIIDHSACIKVYKSSLFKNLRFPKGKYHEDLFLTYKLLDNARTYVFVDLPLYFYYRGNTNSITFNYGVKNYKDECEAIFEMIEYFNETAQSGEAYHFGCLSLFETMIRANGFIDSVEIAETKTHSINWVKNHVFKAEKMSLKKKLVIYTFVDRIPAYIAIRKFLKRY